MESNIIVEDIILELLNGIVLDTPPKLIIEPDTCSDSDEEECSTQMLTMRKKYEDIRNQNIEKMQQGEKSSIIDVDACDSDNSDDTVEYVPENVDKKKKVDTSHSQKRMIIDTHCHLEFIKKRFKRDVSLAECLELDGERLGDKFLGAIVNFCQPSEWSCGADSDQVTSLLRDAADDPRVGVTIGCHPHFSDKMTEARWRQLEALTSGSMEKFSWLRVVALGECGLDYSSKNGVSRSVQMEVFARQLNLAMKFNLPLVLHIRDAEADGLKVLDDVGVPSNYPIHRHCFGGDVKAARVWIRRYPSSKIGVTGLVTRQDAKDVRRVIKDVCLDRILLETDAPYHLPEGAANSQFRCSFPGHVIHVAKEVAKIKSTTVENVLYQNVISAKTIYPRFFEARRPIITKWKTNICTEANNNNNSKKSKE